MHDLYASTEISSSQECALVLIMLKKTKREGSHVHLGGIVRTRIMSVARMEMKYK